MPNSRHPPDKRLSDSCRPAASKAHTRVVVLHNEPEMCKLLAILFGRFGYEAATALNADGAMELLTAACSPIRLPALVLAHADIPGLDISAMIGCMRRSGYAGPIAATTNDDCPRTRDRYLAAGCCACVRPPATLDDLRDLLDSVLHVGPLGRGCAPAISLDASGAMAPCPGKEFCTFLQHPQFAWKL